MKDILLFKRMLTPILVQLIFWLLTLIAVAFGVISLLQHDFLIGIITLVLGPLFARVICEIGIVLFRIHESLIEMNVKNEKTKDMVAEIS